MNLVAGIKEAYNDNNSPPFSARTRQTTDDRPRLSIPGESPACGGLAVSAEFVGVRCELWLGN